MPMLFVLSSLHYCFISDMVGFVHLHDSVLPERYYEIAKNVGIIENGQKDGTSNVPINNMVRFPQLTERQLGIYKEIKNVQVNAQVNVQVNVSDLAKKLNVSEKTIRRDLYVLRDMNLICYI